MKERFLDYNFTEKTLVVVTGVVVFVSSRLSNRRREGFAEEIIEFVESNRSLPLSYRFFVGCLPRDTRESVKTRIANLVGDGNQGGQNG